MTETAHTPRLVVSGNGTRGPFTLSSLGSPITYAAESELVLKRYDSAGDLVGTLVLNADYALSEASVETGDAAATFTLDASEAVLASGQKIVVERVTTKSSDFALQSTGGIFEGALDKVTRLIQEAWTAIGRRVAAHPLYTGSLELPAPEAGTVLAWNASADGLANLDASGASVEMADVVTADTRAEGAFAIGVPWFDPSWAPYSADATGVADASDEIILALAAAETAKRSTLIQGAYLIGATSITGDNMSFVGFGGDEAIYPYTDGPSQLRVTNTSNSPFKIGESVSAAGLAVIYTNQVDTTSAPITYPPLFKNENTTTQVVGFKLDNFTVIGATTLCRFGSLETFEKAGQIALRGVRGFCTGAYLDFTHIPDIIHSDHNSWGLHVYGDEVSHFGSAGAAAILTVSSITRSGTTATVTTAVAHGRSSGANVTISGAVQTDYNVTNAEITVTGANTFTYQVANSPSTPATGTIKAHIFALRDSHRDNATWLRVWGDGTATTLSTVSVDGLMVVNNSWLGFDTIIDVVGEGDATGEDGGFLQIVTLTGGAVDQTKHLLKVQPGGAIYTFTATGFTGYQERADDTTWFGYFIDIEDPAPGPSSTTFTEVNLSDVEMGYMRGGLLSVEGDYVERVSITGFSCPVCIHTTENGDRDFVVIDAPNADIILHMNRVTAADTATGTRTFCRIENARSVDVRGVFDNWDCVIENNSATAKVSFNGKTFNDGGDAIQGTYAGNVKVSSDSVIDSQPELPLKSLVRELAGIMPNRNVLLNGCARIWQNGVGPFTSASAVVNNDDTYLADQVILLSDGNDIIDFSQEAAIKPTGAYASFKLDVETANKKFGLLFPVEARDAARLIGGNAALSFEACKGGSNATTETLRAAIISWQGTADSITSDVVSAWNNAGVDPTLVANWTYETTPQNLTLTTSFQKFDEDDGLSGPIDTASTKQFAVFIWCDDTDATVGDLIYIGNVQCEAGLVATAFEHRPFSQEHFNCSRYYERGGYAFQGEWLSSSTVMIGGRFSNRMRATPTISLNTTAPLVSEIGVANRTGSSSTISVVGASSPTGMASFTLDGFSGATAGKAAEVVNNIFGFDARL